MKRALKSKIITITILTIFIAVIISGCVNQETAKPAQAPKQFLSYSELNDFVKLNKERGYYSYGIMATAVKSADAAAPGAAESKKAADFSATNIQAEGVDEPDIVKNDGKYIYTVSDSKIIIIDAFPAETMNIISEINLNKSIQKIFVNNDKLVVFGSSWYGYYPMKTNVMVESIRCFECGYDNQKSFISVYDITDKALPKLLKDIVMNSSYYDSRMIGNNVYVIMQESVYLPDGMLRLPVIMEDGVVSEIPATDIYYFDYPDTNYNFNTILNINLDTLDYHQKTYLLGYNQNLYVSQNNIYLVSQKYMPYLDYQKRFINEMS